MGAHLFAGMNNVAPLIRSELDALMFHLYGVSREDADYIMDTFPIVRRRDEEAHGEYRTKRLILRSLRRHERSAFEATHGTLAETPNGPRPATRSGQASPRTATFSPMPWLPTIRTNVDPPPAHPSQAHPRINPPFMGGIRIASVH